MAGRTASWCRPGTGSLTLVAGRTVHSNQGTGLRHGRPGPALTVERLDSSYNSPALVGPAEVKRR
ncbi:hypothetical protein AB0P05_37495 [Streptomyces flaveolus]|uniref:hypothetical protein n=1 Tax=Streptomyces flaveolus TaxID=67297 RepID=UPI00341B7CAE